MADRFLVFGQVFIANGTGVITEAGRIATNGNNTLNVTTEGNFTFSLANGATATVSSGTATVAGSPQTLNAGANTVTVTGTGTITLALTIGTAANWNTVNSWSAASGGACGASVPTSADNVYFNANSYTAASQVLTVDAAGYCLNMDWTGATNNPSISGTQPLNVYGNMTTIATMTWSHYGFVYFKGAAGQLLTTNGLSLSCNIDKATTATTLTLADALTCARVYVESGTLDTAGFTVTASTSFNTSGAAAKTITLGASIVNCGLWNMSGAGTITLTANTASIRVTGTGAFVGGGLTTYYEVQLNGSTHTISGSNTFAALTLPAATTQTITFTAGTRQTITTATLSGDATHTHTLKSGTAGSLASIWATNHTDDYCVYTDMLYNYNGVIVCDCDGITGGTFAGAGGSYTSLTMQGAGTYPLTITGSNIFGVCTVDRSEANKTLLATGGTTQTFSHFICDVSSTRTLTIGSTDTTPVVFTKNGLSVLLDYVALTYNTGSPANKWYYGVNSTAGAGVTGWAAEATRISELKLVIMIPLASLIGKAGKAIIVNATEDGFTIET